MSFGKKNDVASYGESNMKKSRSTVYNVIRDSLMKYSKHVSIFGRRNPIMVNLNGNKYFIHANFTHGTGRGRPNELRTQLGRSSIGKQQENKNRGSHVAFIGIFEAGDVFVAWNPDHIFSLGPNTGDSVYAHKGQRSCIESGQPAVHEINSRKLGTTYAIAFPISALGFYLENISRFHSMNNKNQIENSISLNVQKLSESGLGSNGTLKSKDQRIKFTYKREAYPRSDSFRKAVLGAYDHTCCVCNRQLKIVEAAHIIPHHHPESTDSINNGLALCVEHHRLYDDALLLPTPQYKLLYNAERARYLTEAKRAKGLQKVEKFHDTELRMPKKSENQPSKKWLQVGLRLRLAR